MKKNIITVMVAIVCAAIMLVPMCALAEDTSQAGDIFSTTQSEETVPTRATTTGVTENTTIVQESTTASESTVTQENKTKTQNIVIKKADSATNKPLAGAHFNIYDNNDKVIKTGATSSDGCFSFTLDYGTYYYKETISPNGYDLTDNGKHKFVVDGKNTDIVITVEDEKLPDTVKVHTGIGTNEYLLVMSATVMVIAVALIIVKKHSNNKACNDIHSKG